MSVAVDDLKVYYRSLRGDVKALDGVTFSIGDGEIMGLAGESGCGKSTLGRTVLRLYEPTEGRVVFDGTDITRLQEKELRPLRTQMQMVFQDPFASLNPRHSVGRLVGEPIRVHHDPGRKEVAGRVRELLAVVGLPPDAANRYPHEFSGGQRQRVGLARALAADPPVMLTDEPFGALDPITRARLQHELLRVQRELHKTVVFVTHDIDEAILLGDRIAILREGGVLAQYDTPERILAHPADEFVERFLGSDRGIKLLSLRRLDELELAPLDGAEAPRVNGSTTLKDALSLMITTGSRAVVVENGDGSTRGVVTLDMLASLAE